MKKLFFISLLNLIYYTSALQINVIPINKIEEQTWKKLKDMFVTTFSQAYKHVDIKDLDIKFDSTPKYLQSLFDTDRKKIDNLNFEIILATDNQEILGYAISCNCVEENKIYIHHLVVDTSKHNKGIGKILIKACENLHKDAIFVSLSTRKFNDKAIGFYKHLGFYETDCSPKIAYTIRPGAKNNPQILNLEKNIKKN